HCHRNRSLKKGGITLRRYILFLFSLLLVSGLIAGCSFCNTNLNENSEEDEVVDVVNDSSNENNSASSAIDIELQSHDFDGSEEDIVDMEENGFYKKEGTNLTLPDDFPSDFARAVGMSVDAVIIGEDGTVVGDNTDFRAL